MYFRINTVGIVAIRYLRFCHCLLSIVIVAVATILDIDLLPSTEKMPSPSRSLHARPRLLLSRASLALLLVSSPSIKGFANNNYDRLVVNNVGVGVGAPSRQSKSLLHMNLLPGQISKKVIVTGAAGRTGSLVFSLLDKDPRFDAVGLVRSEASAKKLIAKTKCALEEVVISDVTNMEFDNEGGSGSARDSSHPWPYALDDAEAMIICTSAVPQISKTSAIKAMMKIPFNVLTPKKKAVNFRDLQFKYKEGQYPKMVDYVGQKKQIDFAKKLGVKHVVSLFKISKNKSNTLIHTTP